MMNRSKSDRKSSKKGNGNNTNKKGDNVVSKKKSSTEGMSQQEAIARKRAAKGECKTCGRKTHKIKRFPTASRIPLTIEGEVITGICLKCHPIEGYARRDDHEAAGPQAYEGHAYRAKIPNFIDPIASRGVPVHDDDTGTLVSGLTLDPIFRTSDERNANDLNNSIGMSDNDDSDNSNHNHNRHDNTTSTNVNNYNNPLTSSITHQQQLGMDAHHGNAYDQFRSHNRRSSLRNNIGKNAFEPISTVSAAAAAAVDRHHQNHYHHQTTSHDGSNSSSFVDSGVADTGSSIRDDLGGFSEYGNAQPPPPPPLYDGDLVLEEEAEEAEAIRLVREYEEQQQQQQQYNSRTIHNSSPNSVETPYNPISPFLGASSSAAETPNTDNRRSSGNYNNNGSSDFSFDDAEILGTTGTDSQVSDTLNVPALLPSSAYEDSESLDDPNRMYEDPKTKTTTTTTSPTMKGVTNHEEEPGEEIEDPPNLPRSKLLAEQRRILLQQEYERMGGEQHSSSLPNNNRSSSLTPTQDSNSLDAFMQRNNKNRLRSGSPTSSSQQYLPSSYVTASLVSNSSSTSSPNSNNNHDHSSIPNKNELDEFLSRDKSKMSTNNHEAFIHEEGFYPPSVSSSLKTGRFSQEEKVEIEEKNHNRSHIQVVKHHHTLEEPHEDDDKKKLLKQQNDYNDNDDLKLKKKLSSYKHDLDVKREISPEQEVSGEIDQSESSSPRSRNSTKVERILDDLSSLQYPSDESIINRKYSKIKNNILDTNTNNYSLDRDTTSSDEKNKNLQKLSDMYSEDLSRTISALKETNLDTSNSNDTKSIDPANSSTLGSNSSSNNGYNTFMSTNEALQMALDRDASLGYKNSQQHQDTNRHYRKMVHEKESTKTKAKNSDIPIIIKCMHLHKDKAFVHKSALEAMFELATMPDGAAKAMIIQNDGIRAILQSIWSHLDQPDIQICAFNALWALFSIEIELLNNKATTDPLHNNDLSGIIDAIMISMQTNSMNPEVQKVGCGALSCISASKIRGITVVDAGSTQVIVTAVNAMRQHPKHVGVQEWGLRALFNHCLAYEGSKLYFLEYSCKTSRQKTCVVLEAMDNFSHDLGIQEWASRVISCLSAKMECSKILSSSHKCMQLLLKTWKNNENKSNEVVQEALINTFSNIFAASDASVDFAIEHNILFDIFDSIPFYQDFETILVEVCALVANMCVSSDIKRIILEAKGLEIVIKILRMYSENGFIQQEGCRALASICHQFPIAKDQMASRQTIDLIVYILRSHRKSESTVEIVSELLCTLTVSQNIQATILENDYHDDIINIIFSKKENINVVQQGFCLLRNLSTNIGHGHSLARLETIRLLVSLMTKYNSSEDIQMHACAIFWNLSTELREDLETIVDTRIVDKIVRLLQNFPESAVIQCVACGSLWSLMVNLNEVKEQVVKTGGIDALVVALVMYQDNLNVLENATGALSSISVSKKSLEKVATAGGIGSIIETMRNNVSSSSIITYGSIFLRNVSIVDKNYAEEASACASTIIRGMRQNLDDIYLQKECLSTLSALGRYSDTCKERILFAGGRETVEHIMNLYRTIDDIQSLARETMSAISDHSSM